MTGTNAARALVKAAGHPEMVLVLLAVYQVLRTAVVLAFAIFTFTVRSRSGTHVNPLRSSHVWLRCSQCCSWSGRATGHPWHGWWRVTLSRSAAASGCCYQCLRSDAASASCRRRGLVMRGPYRLCRHPVYFGEIVALAGLVLAAPSPANLVVFIAVVAAQVVRMQLEERALTEAFPEYRGYAARTPRILPIRRGRAASATLTLALSAGPSSGSR
jgi:protein-S-isoprenylcysteine O-methyltransferase Ste14